MVGEGGGHRERRSAHFESIGDRVDSAAEVEK
jgi:hypothetical protein